MALAEDAVSKAHCTAFMSAATDVASSAEELEKLAKLTNEGVSREDGQNLVGSVAR